MWGKTPSHFDVRTLSDQARPIRPICFVMVSDGVGLGQCLFVLFTYLTFCLSKLLPVKSAYGSYFLENFVRSKLARFADQRRKCYHNKHSDWAESWVKLVHRGETSITLVCYDSILMMMVMMTFYIIAPIGWAQTDKLHLSTL